MRSLTREGQAFVLQTLDAHKRDDEGFMATIEAQARLRPFQERQAADVSAHLAEVSLSVAPAANCTSPQTSESAPIEVAHKTA